MGRGQTAPVGAYVVAQQIPIRRRADDVRVLGGTVGRVAVSLAEAVSYPRLPLGIEGDSGTAHSSQVLHHLTVGVGCSAAVGLDIPA